MDKYAEDKPLSCKYCYWGTNKGECTRDVCYYLVKPRKKPRFKCKDNCPYSVGQPCIGWCTRKMLEEKGK
ncbi:MULTISPECIES: hypothetical protein [unclassified Butyrivibrio]|uniref:hypothetical protein n=1 Tax=unclassified Butyrivibrio TaxID=2639466 RepID=UPI000424CC44|nr:MULTISPECIES: hypothetical protein [unclassified Butyrivibrio]